MCKEIEVLLVELEENLPGVNYVVGLDVWAISPAQATSARSCIGAALGSDARIGSIYFPTAEETIAGIEACIRYRGHHGSGPDRTFLRSQRFKQIMGRLKESLSSIGKRSTEIASFTLNPDPLRGIMWEFKYLFLTPDGGVVLTGWSSD